MTNLMNITENYLPTLPSRASRKINLRTRGSQRTVAPVQLPSNEFRPRKMYFESKLERSFAMLMFARNNVFDLHEQPPAVDFVDHSGSKRKHIFDFLVTLNNGRKLAIIVKNSPSASKAEFQSKVRQLAQQMPTDFANDVILFTDKSFHTSEGINAERLFKAKTLITEAAREIIGSLIREMNHQTTVEQLLVKAGHPVGGFGAVLEALFDSRIKSAHPEIISPKSIIFRGGNWA